MPKTLYICYFGMRESLVQTQVLPYLREIKVAGTAVSILTFEPDRSRSDLAEFHRIKRQLTEEGIEWHWLPYHKRFSLLATAWDILRGTLRIRSLIRIEEPEILHGRVHVPVLMAALARRLSRRKPKLLFDIRGFFPEEYVDAGVWKADGFTFRIAKSIEQWLLRESDGFVVLTEKARSILFPGSEATGHDSLGRPVEVIPCCVDLGKFKTGRIAADRSLLNELAGNGRFVIAYVGSFGGWYLTKETIDFLSESRSLNPRVFALVLTQSEQEPIREMLREAGFGDDDFLVTRVDASEVPDYLTVADIALSFIKPCYSKQASSPTKNAEYLAMGLPIVANTGTGDTDALIRTEGVGVIIDNLNPEGYREAFKAVVDLGGSVPELPERCKKAAEKHFDLSRVGRNRYQRIYRQLLDTK